MKNLKTTASTATIAGAFGLATFGLAPLVANAAPALQGIPGNRMTAMATGMGTATGAATTTGVLVRAGGRLGLPTKGHPRASTSAVRGDDPC
jgi:hypothetical protein